MRLRSLKYGKGQIGGAFLLLTSSIAVAQPNTRPATETEIESIRKAYGLDSIPDWKHYSVLGVEGFFVQGSPELGARLEGRVHFEPYEVQGTLCVAEAWFTTGWQTDTGYDWSPTFHVYRNWLRETRGDCQIDSWSNVPQHAVRTTEPIPSSTLSFVLSNAAEILNLGFDHATNAVASDEPWFEKFLGYRGDRSFQLSDLEITEESVPGVGFAYRATYRSPDRTEGPVIVFSVTRAGFVVHSVGQWVA